jgi:hypothetical protein
MIIHVELRVIKVASAGVVNRLRLPADCSGVPFMLTRTSRHLSVIAVAVLALMCLFSVGLRAQNISTAQLNGAVHDPSGAVVAGAVITAEDPSKGFSRSTTSDAQGNYQIVLLPPGNYTVTVTSPGFNKLVADNIVLTIGEQAQLTFNLPIGGVDQVVTVSTGADII